MAGVSTALSQMLLNWHLSASAISQPGQPKAVGLTTTTPTSVSAFEIATGSGQSRQSVVYSVWAANSIINSNTVSFGPFTVANQTIVGLQIWNTASSGSTGELMFWYGTLANARQVSSGDSLTFAPGAIVHTLS